MYICAMQRITGVEYGSPFFRGKSMKPGRGVCLPPHGRWQAHAPTRFPLMDGDPGAFEPIPQIHEYDEHVSISPTTIVALERI